MSDLVEEFERIVQKTTNDLLAAERQKWQRILSEGIQIFTGYVPIDTEQLQGSITGAIVEQEKLVDIVITIPDRTLVYEKNKRIKAVRLAMILNAGHGRSGSTLLRSRDNVYAAARSATEGWIDKAYLHWIGVAERLLN